MKLFEIVRTPPIVAISVMLLALTGAASTGILRVADKGTGDGSSWDAPIGVISNALARADELVKDGTYDHVEIWIKEGRYNLVASKNNDEYVPLPSEVTVCGGFAGTETSADQADPVAHPTYLSGDKSFDGQWQKNGSSSGRVNIWIKGPPIAVQEPNPGGTNDYWSAYRGSGGAWDFRYGFRYSGAVSNVCFQGLWFVGGFGDNNGGNAIGPKDATCTLYNCVVSNCQFVATYASGLVFYGRDNLVTHCSFRGNAGALRFYSPTNRVSSGWLPKSGLVKDCEFVENYGDGAVISSDDSVSGGVLLVSNCVFRQNCVRGNPPLISVNATASAGYSVTNLIFDCQFVTNRVRGGAYALIASGSETRQPNSVVEIARSSFLGNNATNGSSNCAVCIYDRSHARQWKIRDCLFAGNVDTSVANVTRAAVIFVSHSSTGVYCQNCTFVSNVVDLAGSSAKATMFYSGSELTSHSFGMVHCVLKDNVLKTGESGMAAEFLMLKPGNACSLSFVNTIFYNTASDYVPYRITLGNFKPYFADICCYHPAGIDQSIVADAVRVVRWAYPVTDTPVFTDLKQGPNGAWAIGVYADPASVGKDALPVFINDDGNMRFYDPEFGGSSYPYFTLHNFDYASRQSAAAAKCTTSNPLLPDAFGAARQFKRSALGPLNAPRTGLMLLLR